MKRILVWDVETTGIPVSYDAPVSDVYNWPRVIQLAYELFWEDGTTIDKKCELIKPDGWKIPTAKFWQDNGFFTEINEEHGVPIQSMLIQFKQVAEAADTIVSHNLGYDYPITACEMFRYGVKLDKKPKKFCTKLASTDVCKIPGYKGRYKWPTLQEAHKILFGKDFDGAHDAGADVGACKAVYLRLKALEELEFL